MRGVDSLYVCEQVFYNLAGKRILLSYIGSKISLLRPSATKATQFNPPFLDVVPVTPKQLMDS